MVNKIEEKICSCIKEMGCPEGVGGKGTLSALEILYLNLNYCFICKIMLSFIY